MFGGSVLAQWFWSNWMQSFRLVRYRVGIHALRYTVVVSCTLVARYEHAGWSASWLSKCTSCNDLRPHHRYHLYSGFLVLKKKKTISFFENPQWKKSGSASWQICMLSGHPVVEGGCKLSSADRAKAGYMSDMVSNMNIWYGFEIWIPDMDIWYWYLGWRPGEVDSGK